MKDYSFGNYICALRTGLGLSQFQLGTLVGVSDKAVSKWENGDAKPRLSTCYRLAEVLGVTVNELLSCTYPMYHARKDLNVMNQNLWKQAYERLAIYGDNPPAICLSRLAAEEAALRKTNAIQSFVALNRIREAAQMHNSTFFATGMISSSFAAWLFGATEVNPLPPHYRCPKCKSSEFVGGFASGFDLPPKKCSCGEEYIRDGHNIPFEEYAQVEQNGTHVELRVSEEFKSIAIESLKQFYSEKAEIMPVQLTDNGHPIGVENYVILQTTKNKPSVFKDGFYHVDVGEYQHLKKNEITFSFIVSDQLNIIQRFQRVTQTKLPLPSQFATPAIFENIYQKRRGSEKLAYIVDTLDSDELHNFDLLVRIEGLLHASIEWAPHRFIIETDEEIEMFRKLPILREDIWNDVTKALAQNDIHDNGLALQAVESTRRGIYANKGIPSNIENALLSIGLPIWYPEQLKKTLYLYPKGHCISHLLLDMTYEWYCENYPDFIMQVAL